MGGLRPQHHPVEGRMDGEVKRENTANNLVENPLSVAAARGEAGN
jgi:hypothetical protein